MEIAALRAELAMLTEELKSTCSHRGDRGRGGDRGHGGGRARGGGRGRGGRDQGGGRRGWRGGRGQLQDPKPYYYDITCHWLYAFQEEKLHVNFTFPLLSTLL